MVSRGERVRAMTPRKLTRLSRFNIAPGDGAGVSCICDRHSVILFVQRFAARDVWGGWSLRWYREFFNERRDDRGRLDEFFGWPRPRPALRRCSGRWRRWRCRAVRAFAGGPCFRHAVCAAGDAEVITGLSLLLLFVRLNAEAGLDRDHRADHR